MQMAVRVMCQANVRSENGDYPPHSTTIFLRTPAKASRASAQRATEELFADSLSVNRLRPPSIAAAPLKPGIGVCVEQHRSGIPRQCWVSEGVQFGACGVQAARSIDESAMSHES